MVKHQDDNVFERTMDYDAPADILLNMQTSFEMPSVCKYAHNCLTSQECHLLNVEKHKGLTFAQMNTNGRQHQPVE